MKKKCIRALLGLAMAALAIPASAQNLSIYVGANYGKSHFTNGCSLAPAPCEKDRDTTAVVLMSVLPSLRVPNVPASLDADPFPELQAGEHAAARQYER